MKNVALLLKLSLRHFFTRDNKGSHHLRGAAAGIGIAIIPVIIVIVAGNGLIEGITKRFQELSSGQLQIRGVYQLEDAERVTGILGGMNDVRYAGTVYDNYGLLHHNGKNAGTVIRGMPADMYQRDAGFKENLSIVEGEFDLNQPEALMISNELAESLSVSQGDRLKLIIHRSFGARTLYKPVDFIVTGIFSTGYYELDATTVYISARRFLNLFGEESAGYILVKCAQEKVPVLMKELKNLLETGFMVMPWYRVNSSMYENFISTKASLLVIMLLIVAIAGLSVSSSVYMLVMEQKDEIAFLKAIGMTNSNIANIFILSGGITGFIGGGLGILAGLLTGIHINEVLMGIELIINRILGLGSILLHTEDSFRPVSIMGGDFYLESIPVIIRRGEILLIYTVGIIVSISGALIPSIRASKVPPIEAIAKK